MRALHTLTPGIEEQHTRSVHPLPHPPRGDRYHARFSLPPHNFNTEKCFCSVDGDDPAELGTATCDMSCAGDSSQTCGGRDAISVYEYTTTAPTPTPPPASSSYDHLGCYTDVASPRVFTGKSTASNAMTAEVSCRG